MTSGTNRAPGVNGSRRQCGGHEASGIDLVWRSGELLQVANRLYQKGYGYRFLWLNSNPHHWIPWVTPLRYQATSESLHYLGHPSLSQTMRHGGWLVWSPSDLHFSLQTWRRCFFARHFLKLKKADREVLSQAQGTQGTQGIPRVISHEGHLGHGNQETNPGGPMARCFTKRFWPRSWRSRAAPCRNLNVTAGRSGDMDRWMDAWIDEGESKKRYIIIYYI